jgi:vacuolar-type H+-ATPase catalytic subunit A/Vma1
MVNEIQENLKQNNKIMKNTYFINQESFAQQFFDNNLATIKDFKQENLIDNLLTKITPIYDATQNTIEKSKSQKKLNEDIINKSYKTQQITNKHKLKNITQTRRNNLNY